jgi:hypothetical protein
MNPEDLIIPIAILFFIALPIYLFLPRKKKKHLIINNQNQFIANTYAGSINANKKV